MCSSICVCNCIFCVQFMYLETHFCMYSCTGYKELSLFNNINFNHEILFYARTCVHVLVRPILHATI